MNLFAHFFLAIRRANGKKNKKINKIKQERQTTTQRRGKKLIISIKIFERFYATKCHRFKRME